ncbi:hypothetical protein [Azohydromonas caseinilytica]|uniref:Uncharacterized protein n=1 Tax=Azohydromonas caseinilytica TaxID=2728836 RepID=A0A848FID6_9BURK|nr:hypothetical protein [Azohydromonas caseinilytica]NML18013.1 hypothetical protein [Azohydromonas caseinilytica]
MTQQQQGGNQQQGSDNPRGTVPHNEPRGGAQAQATAPAAGQQDGTPDSGTDASRGTPDVMGRQGGDRSASNRPELDGQGQGTQQRR